MNSLQTFYNKSCGMFGSYPHDFWTTANAIEVCVQLASPVCSDSVCSNSWCTQALTNYIQLTGDHRFASDIPYTFSEVSTEYFASGYFDDQLW